MPTSNFQLPASGPTTALSILIHVRATLPESILQKLRKIFDEQSGVYPVCFLIDDVDGQRRIKASAKIQFSDVVVRAIEDILGVGTVRIG